MGAHLPDDFVVVPTKFGKLAQRLEAQCRSGKQKTTTPSGKLSPQCREKFPTGKTSREKPRPEGLPRTGKVNVVAAQRR
jgi:hypothetical protein